MFKILSLSRVTSASLDPRKHWYVATKDVCGTRPMDFSKNEIFRRFPDKLRNVVARELLPAKSANSEVQQDAKYCVRSFYFLINRRSSMSEGISTGWSC